MSPQVLSGVVRVTTHPRVFKEPSALDEALQFAEVLLAQPGCVVVEPGEAHWNIFTRLCRAADARGSLVPDAWFAAMAIEAGCEWVTLDRDYARFSGLEWRLPG
jgi:toxin-antitoxin system PIN domain toxin